MKVVHPSMTTLINLLILTLVGIAIVVTKDATPLLGLTLLREALILPEVGGADEDEDGNRMGFVHD